MKAEEVREADHWHQLGRLKKEAQDDKRASRSNPSERCLARTSRGTVESVVSGMVCVLDCTKTKQGRDQGQ